MAALMNTRFCKVIGFVDWNTAIIASGALNTGGRVERVAETSLRHTEEILSDYLAGSPARSIFRIQLRLYAGWWAGKTPTDYYRGIAILRLKYAGRQREYRRANKRVVFQAGDEGIQLSDRLACVNGRLTRKERVHFLDTVRLMNGRQREKMVDTALVTDLVGLVHRKEADRYVVISDDDDVLAGLIYSESLGADVKMLSRPEMSSKYMAHIRDMIHTY